ncbi:MAG: hypothetical protein AB7F82_04570 [Alphaproteobacteria bacterium]
MAASFSEYRAMKLIEKIADHHKADLSRVSVRVKAKPEGAYLYIDDYKDSENRHCKKLYDALHGISSSWTHGNGEPGIVCEFREPKQLLRALENLAPSRGHSR